MRTNNKKTKEYEIKGKKKNRKDKKKHSKLKKVILIFFIIIILMGLAGIGVFAGLFFSDKWKITKEDLVIGYNNTMVYDSEGNFLCELSGDENRKIISLSQMGKYIPNAFVAIEDERFEKHSGVDIKRTAGAIVSFILNGGKSSYGGSTITQQLVKNMMNEDEDEGIEGVKRKIREWSRAYQMEQMLSKSQILEIYLNQVFMGGGTNIYGVEKAANYYFNKSAADLSLAQSAFLAGINRAPNAYNPYGEEDNTEAIKKVTKTVLAKMKELGMIETEEEYNEAIETVDKGLVFTKGEIADTTDMSYHTAAAIDQVVEEFAELKEVNTKEARRMLYSGGYKLYTTQVTNIQERMEKEFLRDKYIFDSKKTKDENGKYKHTQAGMAIIEQSTGKVVGVMGGLGEDSSPLGLNRATQTYRQCGSTMKPLAAVAAGLNAGVITAATVYDDSWTNFGNWAPGNSTGYMGLASVRRGIERSSNIINLKIMSNLGPENSIKFLNSLGLDTYNEEDNMLSLAIGGSTHGSSPLQMAAAYAAIANDGEYITPIFYTELKDSNGNTVLKPKQETRRVISAENAYIVQSILLSSVNVGIAGEGWISGMDSAGKTGTTNNYVDRWYCGFTPYYTGATWYGFDENEKEPYVGNNPSGDIWGEIMRDVHKNLATKRFEKPSGVVTAKICKQSGKLATDKCKDTYWEYFVSGTVPSACEGHTELKICKDTGKIATEYCKNTETKIYTNRPEREQNPNWSTSAGDKYNVPTATCDKHTKPVVEQIKVPNVIGKTETEAKSMLSKFSIQLVYEENTTAENGIVLRQSLQEGTVVDVGTSIVIFINKKVTTEPTPEEPEEPDEPNPNPNPNPNVNRVRE